MKNYQKYLTASINLKGVLDVDTVKGCSLDSQNIPMVDAMVNAMQIKQQRRVVLIFQKVFREY